MPAQSVDNLFRSLNKSDFAPAYYFYGPEDVLKDDAVKTLLDKALDPTLRDFNYDQRSAAQLDADDVDALCNTLPMLADRRVVLVRDVESWKRKTKARAQILRYLAQPSRDTIVILMQGSAEEGEDKELATHTTTVRFDPLPAERARKWLMNQAEILGVTLELEAAEHLIRSVGNDLGALKSELSKLASLPAGQSVSAEIIGDLVGIRQGETVWDWRDAVLHGETGRAATLLPSVLAQSGVSGVKLVTALGTALVGVGVARAYYDRGTRGRALESTVMKSLLSIRPFGVLSYKEEAARWSRWAPDWDRTRIRSALRASRDTDEALKNTTVSDEQGLMTDLVLRLGQWSERKSTRLMATMATVVIFCATAISIFSVPAAAQTDSRLIEAIRQAQEGRGDSARTKVRLMLAATSPTDTLYPQIIYTQAMVASDANEMRRQLQRVAVEYSSSSWADDALLRLVQLDYASGNLEGAARNLERIRLDYPGSPLVGQASYWAARTYFDQKSPEMACRWIADGLSQTRGNVELQNQLGYLDQRCAGVRASLVSGSAADSQTAQSGTDTAALPADVTDSTSGAPTSAQPTTVAPAPPAAAPARPESAQPTPATAGAAPPAGKYRIQVTAVKAQTTADGLAAKLRKQGLSPVVVQDAGLYKVRVGSYATRSEAVAALSELKGKLGGSLFVVAEP
jgi:DNA polymerase III subunit delta